jgi:hypothetical protein
MAAYDTINQVRILSQRRLLHSWWHNSHSMINLLDFTSIFGLQYLGVFTALCVMLAFRMLSPQSKAEVGLLDSVDVDQVISQGTDLLQEVGEHCHPLASRYLHWFQKLQMKMPTLMVGKASNTVSNRPNVDAPSLASQGRPEDVHDSFSGDTDSVFVSNERPMDDSLMVSRDDLFELENVFFSTGWDNPIE